jgi:hypothetical protein
MEIVTHVRGGGKSPDVYNEPGYNTININVIFHHLNHHHQHRYYCYHYYYHH